MRNQTRFRIFLLSGGMLLVGVLAFFLVSLQQENPQVLQKKARAAFDRGAYETAKNLADDVLRQQPENSKALLLAGDASARLEEFSAAIAYYDRVPAEKTDDFITARNAAGDLLLLKLHRLTEAEQRFREVLNAKSDDETANDRMAFLLGLTARQQEQIAFRLRLIRGGHAKPLHLLSLALADSALENPELVAEYRQNSPDDPAILVALARLSLEKQDYQACRKHLSEAISAMPALVEARVQFGQLLYDHGRPVEFSNWLATLPKRVDQHPETWVLRARWAQRAKNNRQAVRCFGEALKRDPNNSRANYQLGRLLASMSGKKAAAPFLDRAKNLRQYVNIVKVAYSGEDGELVKAAVETAESLGLIWEAYAWASLANGPNAPFRQDWAKPALARLKPQIHALPLTRAKPSSNPILALELNEFPLPTKPAFVETRPTKFKTTDGVSISFANQADSAGLRFQHFNGRESVKNGLVNMYEFSGGGVAVLDFDGDLLPDLLMTQGCRWPPKAGNREHIDRLFRNLGNGKFVDVTSQVGIQNFGFGQGVTVGDFNSDGWPDLLIANIGRNRLYENNGDGTFSDVTTAAGLTDDQWTASCVMTDLTGDGLADIYCVNYVGGKDVFSRTCRTGNRKGMCLPHLFNAAQDQVYVNRGAGRFENITDRSGIVVPNGKGLGIVAADFDGSQRLGLFVANDTTPNFFFRQIAPERRGRPASATELRYQEGALLNGLAMNAAGKTESCMGIAVGDADGDGRLDLFVTNFLSETNTLYLQTSPGVFSDETVRSGLGPVSLSMVGFGTQFLDADLDGHLDLLVTNGHIDDFRKTTGSQYQMPPQFFSNNGMARFQLVDKDVLGPYFRKTFLGRAMARLDWNADGREDVAISHLDAPVALLTNTTAKTGGAIALKLCGVKSHRDAVGTTVTVDLGDRKVTRQLTAGDGYYSSNERILIFGIGAAQSIRRMTINWPSGRVDEFKEIPANSRWAIVEGRSQPLSLPFNARRKSPNSQMPD